MSVIRSLSVASLRISAESSKGIHGIVKRCSWNRQKVFVESSKGVRGIVKGCPQNRQKVPANL